MAQKSSNAAYFGLGYLAATILAVTCLAVGDWIDCSGFQCGLYGCCATQGSQCTGYSGHLPPSSPVAEHLNSARIYTILLLVSALLCLCAASVIRSAKGGPIRKTLMVMGTLNALGVVFGILAVVNAKKFFEEALNGSCKWGGGMARAVAAIVGMGIPLLLMMCFFPAWMQRQLNQKAEAVPDEEAAAGTAPTSGSSRRATYTKELLPSNSSIVEPTAINPGQPKSQK